MAEADAKEMATKSPIEHLRDAVKLIKIFYAEELKKPMDRTIRIKNDFATNS